VEYYAVIQSNQLGRRQRLLRRFEARVVTGNAQYACARHEIRWRHLSESGVKMARRNLQISRKRIRLSRWLQPQSPLHSRPASPSVRGFDAFAFNDFISQDAALLLEQINQQKSLFALCAV